MHADSRGGAEALLLAAGKSLEQLPVAIQDAIRKGTVREAMWHLMRTGGLVSNNQR